MSQIEHISETGEQQRTERINPRIFLLALGMFALGTDAFVVAGVLPVIARELSVTESLAGQLVTAFSFTYALGSPLLAALTGRWSRNRVLSVALGTFCLFNLASALAPNFAMLFLTRILVGCSATVFGPLAYTTGTALAPSEKRGKALALVASGLTIATVLGSPLGTWVGEQFGWRFSFGMVALLGGIAFFALLFGGLPKAAPAPALSLQARLVPMKEPRLLLALIPALLWNLGFYILYTYIAPLLQLNLKITDVSLFLLFQGLGPMIGNWLVGSIVDRIGATRPIFISLIALTILEPLLALLTHSPVSAALILFLWGLCVPLQFTAQQHRLLRLAPEHANVILALNNSTFYLGIAGGAALGGLVLHSFTVTQLGWFGAAFILVSLFLFMLSVSLSKRNTPVSAETVREEALVAPE